MALGQLNAEIHDLLSVHADAQAVARRYLWLGLAYHYLKDSRSAEEAFEEAIRHDNDAKREWLEAAATKEALAFFETTLESLRRKYRTDLPKRRMPRIWLRVGVMSGFTVLAVNNPKRNQEPLALNAHLSIGVRPVPLEFFVATGASPRLRGAPMVGLLYRPKFIAPAASVFVAARLETQQEPARLAAGVAVDFRVWSH
jgi:tetratricopeptide (TPR) repeat protein